MAIELIEKHDTFGNWRDKINTISINIGDLQLLNTPVISDIVSAINSLNNQSDEKIRRAAIISLALN
jgi:hypothetical protein